MEYDIFAQLSLVIAVAVGVSMLMRILRQPLIVGYILTGILVGPSLLHLIADKATFESFSSIGIALLLFIIGMGLNATIIKQLGKVVIFVAALEIFVMGILGYIVAKAIGFSDMEGLFIGAALTFSSTIIIVKVLNDKREQTRLYGQICIGILLVEDIVATIALLMLSTSTSGSLSLVAVGILGLKGLALAALLTLVSTQILPRLSKFIAGSQEFLFLFAIAWGFGVANFFALSGFSIEVGALFAGVSLASLPYSQEIVARLKPLRDFFVVVFFIVLGEGLQLNNIGSVLLPALVFSLMVILLKPILVMTGLGLLGYTKRTSFKSGIPIAQISEFSLILVVLAHTTGLVSPQIIAIVTLVAIITIAVSTYLMHYDDQLYNLLENRLHLFERRIVRPEQKEAEAFPIVLFGYHKGGHEFVKTFREMHKRFVVVDYNPEIIESLEAQRVHYLYGDATDPELLDEVGINKAKLVVSTITDYDTNVQLVKHIHGINKRAVIVLHADTYEEAAELYQHGATYVMLPHYIGSERISAFIKRNGLSRTDFERYREKHLLLLEKETET